MKIDISFTKLLIAFIVIYEIIRFFLKNTQKYLTSLHQ
ncbi:hypothetical protein LTSERUB_3199 [Salmonella enterica subsp. enterica serovar Rubislaw str. A4-653]|uniref:Uncharacterized protein n=1 Tax=Salmonella enterica subsp. enterica serovar Rubislaw str. A4-653 TaxID=913081 RepID=G5QKI8_SALRU|nr:hypothetical protein LTSERUB_3199 [Salmonella enterica subsp. enterica serovar Rubislaw str. A4-653]